MTTVSTSCRPGRGQHLIGYPGHPDVVHRDASVQGLLGLLNVVTEIAACTGFTETG
jgi:hypothetical protein